MKEKQQLNRREFIKRTGTLFSLLSLPIILKASYQPDFIKINNLKYLEVMTEHELTIEFVDNSIQTYQIDNISFAVKEDWVDSFFKTHCFWPYFIELSNHHMNLLSYYTDRYILDIDGKTQTIPYFSAYWLNKNIIPDRYNYNYKKNFIIKGSV